MLRNRWVSQSPLFQGHAAFVVLLIHGRPVASIVTTRSSRPIVGVARHTVKAAAVAPAAVGWKLKLVIPPAVILMPDGAAVCAFSGVPLRMIQPCSQPPDPAQVSPSADM